MFVIIFLFALTQFIYAQIETSVEGYAAVSAGMARYDLSDLNSYMRKAGFSNIESHNIPSLGFNIYSVLNNSLYTGISASGLFGERTENDSIMINLSGGTVFFDVGYQIFEKKSYRITPLLGLGLSKMKINSVSKEVGRRGFHDALNNPAGNSSIVLPSMEAHFSILNSFIYDMHKFNASGKDMVFKMGVSFRAGAIIKIGQQNWEIENQGQVVGGPDMGRYVLYSNIEIPFGASEIYR